MAPLKATQEFVPIKEIRDGIVVLKDGSMRALLSTNSINFALKSEEEQNSIIFQFQNFLNSLDFSVQIFIQSRRLDIRPYLASLEERYQAQTSDLMKIQTREYIEYIKSFTESVSIMTKEFYVVVPYAPALLGSNTNLMDSLLPKNKDKKNPVVNVSFDEHRSQLMQRIDIVRQGLSSMGLRPKQEDTEHIINLYHRMFNPGTTEKPIKMN